MNKRSPDDRPAEGTHFARSDAGARAALEILADRDCSGPLDEGPEEYVARDICCERMAQPAPENWCPSCIARFALEHLADGDALAVEAAAMRADRDTLAKKLDAEVERVTHLQTEIIHLWDQAEITEGQAARMLGVDTLEANYREEWSARVEGDERVEWLEGRLEKIENERDKLDNLAELDGAAYWTGQLLKSFEVRAGSVIRFEELAEVTRETVENLLKERDRLADLAPETASRERRESLKAALEDVDQLLEENASLALELKVHRQMLDDAYSVIDVCDTHLQHILNMAASPDECEMSIDDFSYHAKRGLDCISNFETCEGGPLLRRLGEISKLASEKAETKVIGAKHRALKRIAALASAPFEDGKREGEDV